MNYGYVPSLTDEWKQEAQRRSVPVSIRVRNASSPDDRLDWEDWDGVVWQCACRLQPFSPPVSLRLIQVSLSFKPLAHATLLAIASSHFGWELQCAAPDTQQRSISCNIRDDLNLQRLLLKGSLIQGLTDPLIQSSNRILGYDPTNGPPRSLPLITRLRLGAQYTRLTRPS